MAISGHEQRSEEAFRKSVPNFFAGGPKPEKPKFNPFEESLRSALTRGSEPEIAMALTSFIADELRVAVHHRPPDKYARAGMIVAKHHGEMQPDELIAKVRELIG